jgi:hypothetical protein
VALRYDYAVFQGDRYVRNAMLTRAEAREFEEQGMRCIDTARTMDPAIPRFRVPRYVGPRRTRRGCWGR